MECVPRMLTVDQHLEVASPESKEADTCSRNSVRKRKINVLTDIHRNVLR